MRARLRHLTRQQSPRRIFAGLCVFSLIVYLFYPSSSSSAPVTGVASCVEERLRHWRRLEEVCGHVSVSIGIKHEYSGAANFAFELRKDVHCRAMSSPSSHHIKGRTACRQSWGMVGLVVFSRVSLFRLFWRWRWTRNNWRTALCLSGNAKSLAEKWLLPSGGRNAAEFGWASSRSRRDGLRERTGKENSMLPRGTSWCCMAKVQEGECACVVSTVYAHRTRPHVFVQDLQVVNPTVSLVSTN